MKDGVRMVSTEGTGGRRNFSIHPYRNIETGERQITNTCKPPKAKHKLVWSNKERKYVRVGLD